MRRIAELRIKHILKHRPNTFSEKPTHMNHFVGEEKMRRSFLIVGLVVLILSAFLFSDIQSANAANNLSLTIPTRAAEGDGLLAGAGSISISAALPSDLVVDLVSDDTSEMTVPAAVTVPAGRISAVFDLTVVDDSKVDGVETVSIAASAPGWISANDSIAVFDNDFVDIRDCIAGGREHTLALKEDGTVWAWGGNRFSELGDGSQIKRDAPVQVLNLSDVVAVNINLSHHSLALKADGTVWAWGNNGSGQLGDGTHTSRDVPVKVLNLIDVTAIAAGPDHSMALKADGTVWAWGDNLRGEVGEDAPISRSSPIQVHSRHWSTNSALPTNRNPCRRKQLSQN